MTRCPKIDGKNGSPTKGERCRKPPGHKGECLFRLGRFTIRRKVKKQKPKPVKKMNSEDYFNVKVWDLESAADDYTMPRWYKQPKHVEIWLEKQALAEECGESKEDCTCEEDEEEEEEEDEKE